MTKGKPWSEEIRKKLSEAHKGKHSPMKGKKTGKPSWNKGKKGVYSAETIERMKSAQKINTQGEKNGLFGKIQSEETSIIETLFTSRK